MKNCIYAISLSFIFLACSAKKNKPINKGYHSLVSSYNVLFNGSTSIDEGVQEEYATNKENFWDILPVEKIKISDEIITVSGINNKKFLVGEEKAAKTVQKHSMLIRGNQENPKIANAYLMLGRARYLDQRFVPAIEAFNQVSKQKSTPSQLNEALIWIAKCNIRLEQEILAIKELKKLLKNEKLNEENSSKSNAFLSMAYLQLEDYQNAEKFLKAATENESNNKDKARYMYITAQLMEKRSDYDSALIYFKKVSELKRKIPREFYINSTLKKILYDSLGFERKEKLIFKMIDNYENEDFLDKIYFSYSTILFTKDSLSEGKKYLNKSIKNNSDKRLLFRAYNKLADIYFKNFDYVKSKKYLDSTLQNIDKKSKKYWEIERQREGLDKIVELEEKILLYDSLIRISNYDDDKLNEILKNVKIERSNETAPAQKNSFSNPEILTNNSLSYSNFYFYNSDLVDLGKKSFKANWGDRKRNTYWRLSGLVSNDASSSEKKIEDSDFNVGIEESESTLDEKYLSLIPRTKKQKDSVLFLKNKSILNLAEIYFIKYSDNKTALNKLNNLVDSEPPIEIDSNAKYLLHKIYVESDPVKAEGLKNEIILKYPETKFAKILNNSNNLILEKEIFIRKLDSFQNLFDQQKFQKVIGAIEKEITFIDDIEVLVDYELLKAASIGRLEGILSYQEKLKEIYKNYPNSTKTKNIINTVNQINKKWKKQPIEDTKGSYFLLFSIDSKDSSQKFIGELKRVLGSSKAVLFQPYNYNHSLIVIKDFQNKDEALETKSDIQKNSKMFKLKNYFVVLSSQYKNMLIYKTLESNEN